MRLLTFYLILLLISFPTVWGDDNPFGQAPTSGTSTPTTQPTSQLPQSNPNIKTVQAEGTTSQLGNNYQIPQANSITTTSSSVLGVTSVTLTKEGQVTKADSATKLENNDLEAFGVNGFNQDDSMTKIDSAIQLTDKSGFTLQNVENVKIQVIQETADVETVQGDYYEHREIVVTRADHADINTPDKVLAYDADKIYSTGDILTFDRASTLILTNPQLPLDNLGQTRVLFDRGNPNMTREVRTMSQDKTLTMPNQL